MATRHLAAVVFAAVCGLSAAGGSAPFAARAQGSGAPVYAIIGGSGERVLSRRNPVTLAQIGPAVRLSDSVGPQGFSRDGSQLAFLSWAGDAPSVRFLDLARMRWRGSVQLPTNIAAVRWTGEGTLLALAERPDGVRAIVVDAARRRIVARRRIPGHVEGAYVEATAAGTALLLRPSRPVGLWPVQLAVVRPSGAVTVVTLSRIQAGYVNSAPSTIRRPALVVDPSASRAYVLGGLDEPIGEVDLATLAVSYHALRGRQPLPGTRSSDRSAAWLGSGRIAFVGFDDAGRTTVRLGLSVFDRRTWTARKLDPRPDFLARTGGLLLGIYPPDDYLGAFGLDGRRRFALTVPGLDFSAVAANGRYLYLYNLGPDQSALVLDARSGATVSQPSVSALNVLISPGS